MKIYWTYKSPPEFTALDDAERKRILALVRYKAWRHWQMWAAFSGYVLLSCVMIWIVDPAIQRLAGAVAPILSPPLYIGAIYVGLVMLDRMNWHLLRPYIRRELPGWCRGCGYDLTGNVSGACPECGLEISTSSTQ